MNITQRRAAHVAAIRLTSDEGKEMQITLNYGWPQAIVTGIYAVLWWGGFYG